MSPPILFFGVILAAWWCAALAIFAIDPFRIYPWALNAPLKSADYAPNVRPFLVEAVAKDSSVDFVLIGSSPMIPVSRQMILQAFPGVRNPFNLSYGWMRPSDRALVTRQLIAYSKASRFLLTLDWAYQLPIADNKDIMTHDFPTYLYDDTPWDDIRMVGKSAGEATAAAVLSRQLWLNHWNLNSDRRQRAREYQKFQTRQTMEGLASAIRLHRGDIDHPTQHTCADFDALSSQLVPFAKQASRRAIQLDILIPTFSTAYYYWWLDNLGALALTGPSMMNDQLLLRRCLVDAVADLPNVRVFAFDNEDWITSDLANFKDPGHIYNDKILEFELKSIASGSHRLTKSNIDTYVDTLRRNILRYKLKNSKLGIDNG